MDVDYVRVEWERQHMALAALLLGGGGGTAAGESGRRTLSGARTGAAEREALRRKTVPDAERTGMRGRFSFAQRDPERGTASEEILSAWESFFRDLPPETAGSGVLPGAALPAGASDAAMRRDGWTAERYGGVQLNDAAKKDRRLSAQPEETLAAELERAVSPGTDRRPVGAAAWGDLSGFGTDLVRSGAPGENIWVDAAPVQSETVEAPDAGNRARTLSRAFQRDARRYDGGFSLL